MDFLKDAPFKIGLTVCLLPFLAGPAMSQTGKDINWRDKGNNKAADFYQVQESFNDFWLGKTPQKGQGYTPFKRWEAFMAPRVYPSGDLALPSTNYANYMLWETSENRGATLGDWTELGPMTVPMGYDVASGRIDFVRFDPSDSDIMYVGSPDGGLWKSTNGGTSWSTNTDFLTIIGVADIAIDPTNTQTMYLATGAWESDRRSIGVLKSTDGGDSWDTTSLTWTALDNYKIRRMLMDPSDPNIMMVATDGGVFRTTDGWDTNDNVTCCQDFYDLEFKPGDSNTVYAVGTEFWKSLDNGENWSQVTTGLPLADDVSRMVMAVTPANSAYVYIVAGDLDHGYYGTYRSTDSGQSFALQSDSPNILNSSDDATGTGGQANHDLAIAVSPTDVDEVTIGGINIWQSYNGAVDWDLIAYWYGDDPDYPGEGETFAPYVHADIQDLQYLPGSSATLFATCDGGIWKSTNGGGDWINISNNLSVGQQTSIAVSSSTADLLVAGEQDVGTVKYSAGTWSGINGGDGEDAFIHRSDDDIIVSSNPDGGHAISFDGGVTHEDILGLPSGTWFSRISQDPVVETTVYVGGREELYRKTDLFTNNDGVWEILGAPFSPDPVAAYAVSPSDNQIIYAMSESAVSVSTDAGVNWADRTGDLPVADATLTDIEVSNSDSDLVWVTFSGYSDGNKVFRTTDAGQTWENFSAGLPNLPINAIVTVNDSPTGEAYIGADIGIYYLADSSVGTWAAFTNNLPNVAVTDLEIFYPTSMLRAATYGRGSWESPLGSGTSAVDGVDGSTEPGVDFVDIFPNPSQDGWFNLELTKPTEGAVVVEVINVAGQFVSRSVLQDQVNSSKIHVPTAGVYFVAVRSSNGLLSSRRLITLK